MKLINLTPHPVVIIGDDAEIAIEIPPEKKSARLAESTVPLSPVECDGVTIPMLKKTYVTAENLPDEQPDTRYIVSVLVLLALRDIRHDLVCPDTGPGSVVRDADGNIIGIRRLQK